MYICIDMSTYIYIYISIYMYTYIYIYVYICICGYSCVGQDIKHASATCTDPYMFPNCIEFATSAGDVGVVVVVVDDFVPVRHPQRKQKQERRRGGASKVGGEAPAGHQR